MSTREILHGRTSGYARGCRCDECRKANTDRQRKALESRRQRRGSANFEHGKGGHKNWGCRCDICCAGLAEYQKGSRANRKARTADGSDDVPHGTVSGYTGWGCRCRDCAVAAGHSGEPRKLKEYEHGTTGRYKERGCRCSECRAAVAAYQRQRMARLKVARTNG